MFPDIRVSAVQTDLFWEDKNANLKMLENKIVALRGQTEIVILPEMFSTGFSMNPSGLAEPEWGKTMQWMKRLSAENKLIITGSLMMDDDEAHYNRLIWMLPNGTFGYYNKRHLFGFAGERAHYSPGNARFIASVNGWKIQLQICYDLRFPVWARHSSPEAPEFDVLVYVANWPEKRNTAWKSLLIARAIENQCYVVGVNRVGKDGNGIYHSGDSMIIDPLGQVLRQAAHEETILTEALSYENLQQCRHQFPFLRDGDAFIRL
ncbi:MAG TPA: amidohydrolase [Ferruginibacter sp.]|nr:amidohydrolase [Ferruginibacter sp.]HRO17710.1 amidohydrolase [Ferruginibacter sp.]HRQ20103.1 amidohydrolase [Ferruginibacter sp.]